MVSLKKVSLVAASAAVAALMAVSLAGCGEDVAATWSHGKIMEEDITTAATNQMSYYTNDDGSTDVDSWTKYIEERQYESEDEDADDEEATESKDSKDSEEATEESSEKGTVAEYREYLIKQQLRSEIIKYQIEQQKIEVSDEEIDAEVDNEAALYEAYYGGGMSGTFESILENYFGMTMEQFRESVGEYLAEQKLQDATVGSADDEATEEGEEAAESEESTQSEDEEVDYDKLFEEYLDGQVEEANLNVKACPSDLSYDPAVVAKSAEEAASSEEGEESEDSSADSSEESADDEATKEDDSSDAKE